MTVARDGANQLHLHCKILWFMGYLLSGDGKAGQLYRIRGDGCSSRSAATVAWKTFGLCFHVQLAFKVLPPRISYPRPGTQQPSASLIGTDTVICVMDWYSDSKFQVPIGFPRHTKVTAAGIRQSPEHPEPSDLMGQGISLSSPWPLLNHGAIWEGLQWASIDLLWNHKSRFP